MGADSISILADLGYSPGEIDDLLQARVTSMTSNNPQPCDGSDPSIDPSTHKRAATKNGKAA
jgi:hypothetical protein